ncbi:nuclease [Ruegeria lacuscaerulensis ITI-1157]|nr:nuclease [Ruegeria lacuscaerulensis ITI-1157]SHI46266.1 Endonuclease YncB, thermonuclease family [Ruegeria lacuscaerulensis ITI-1157]
MLRICSAFVLCLTVTACAAAPLTGRISVIDADTWDVGGVRVRLHGIDAPELDQTCQDAGGAIWSCGAWVTNQVRQSFGGKRAVCTQRDIDRYGRIVAACRVAGADAGELMVRAGLAFAYRKYSGDYIAAENRAVAAGVGLHAGKVQAPWLYRGQKSKVSSKGCDIKGNVSSKGERIYHVPGQRHYARTKISPAKGERWFCSPAEARAAGWRAARR